VAPLPDPQAASADTAITASAQSAPVRNR